MERLGCLPLAVIYQEPETWLATFDAHKLRDRRLETAHDSLEVTLEMSMEELAISREQLGVSPLRSSVIEKSLENLQDTLGGLGSQLNYEEEG